MHSDGWEEWEAAQPDGSTAEGAKGAAVPFAVAWLLGHVRYGLIPRVHCRPLTQAQSAVLMHEPVVLAGGMLLPGREQSARLRALSAESAALLMLLPPIGDADAPPRLLLCGPRCTVMHALSLLKHATSINSLACFHASNVLKASSVAPRDNQTGSPARARPDANGRQRAVQVGRETKAICSPGRTIRPSVMLFSQRPRITHIEMEVLVMVLLVH